MATIEEAIKELEDRMELWEDFRRSKGAREWREILKLARDALKMQKQNIMVKRDILDDLREAVDNNPGAVFSADVVREIVEQFRTEANK